MWEEVGNMRGQTKEDGMKKQIEVPVGYKVYRDDTGWVCKHVGYKVYRDDTGWVCKRVSGTEAYAPTLGQALRKCIIAVTRYQLAEDGIYE